METHVQGNKKALIFDLDGVLRNTSKLHEMALRVACAKLHLSQDWEYVDLGGLTTPEVFWQLSSTEGAQVQSAKLGEFIHQKKIFTDSRLDSISINVEILASFERLAQDYRLLLYTGASEPSVKAYLNRIGGAGSVFEKVLISGFNWGSKLKSSSFAAIAEELSLGVESIWMFDDSLKVKSVSEFSGVNFCHVYGDQSSECNFLPVCSENCISRLSEDSVRAVVGDAA